MVDSGTEQSHAGAVAWHEWGEESFRLAQETDRPILLDISAVWCHWCHVMDRTTYSDPTVVDLIHRLYVPVRVDNDRRPDINERYNMGGWPTTAFLTPTGETLTGGTYIPPEQMRRLLVQVAEYYKRNKQDIYDKLSSLRPHKPAPPTASANALGPSIVTNVVDAVHDAFDVAYGGFGDAPKFPHPEAIELALRDYRHRGDRTSYDVMTKTLDMMGTGGIYDQVEGGFFRYSTTRDWRIPHYEKMLEGNAGLLSVYLRAHLATRDVRYAAKARDIMRYVTAHLSDQEQGGFFGSQDADEEYYALPLPDRRRRPAPPIDRTIYTDWNAQMCSAYLLAGAVLDDEAAQQFALRTLERLWNTCRHESSAMYHYFDGAPHLPGLLADQVSMGMAMIDAYEATGDSRYLARAQELAAFCVGSLSDNGGGFADRPEQPTALGNLRVRLVPMPANSLAARLFLRLHYLTDRPDYRDQAEGTLRRFADTYQRFGFFAAPYALAVEELEPPIKIVVIGDPRDERRAALLREARRCPDPWRLVQAIDPQHDGELLERSGFPIPDQPVAYACVGTTCLAPAADPQKLITALNNAQALKAKT